MSEALLNVGIDVDLSGVRAQLTEFPKAAAQAAKAAGSSITEGMARSQAALEQQIASAETRIKKQFASRRDEEKALAKLQAEEAAKAQASSRLDDIIAQGDAQGQLRLQYERTVAEIDAYAAKSGDATKADAARTRATDNYAQAMERLESAAKGAERAIEQVDDSAKSVADASGKAGSNAAKLAGALSLVSPEAGEAARTLADLGDVGEVAGEVADTFGLSLGRLATILGPVAIAAGVLGAAWYALSREAEAAEAAVARAAASAQAWAEASARWKPIVGELADEVARLSGAETAESQALEARIVTMRVAREETGQLLRAEAQRLEALALSGRATYEDLQARTRAHAQVRAYTADTERFAETMDLAAEKTRLDAEALAAQAEASQRAASAATAHATALATRAQLLDDAASIGEADYETAYRRELAAIQAVEDELRRARVLDAQATAALGEQRLSAAATYREASYQGYRDEVAAQAAASDQADAIVERSTTRQLGEVERLRQEQAAALDEYATLSERAGKSADAVSAGIAAITTDYEGQISAAVARAQDASSEAATATGGAWRDHFAQAAQYATQFAGTYEAAMSRAANVAADNYQSAVERQAELDAYLTDSQREAMEERVDAARKAAMRTFEAHKAAQLGMAVVNTASAVVSALDDAPAPLNYVLAAAAGAAGAVEIGTIASTQPSFHVGTANAVFGGSGATPYALMPDERQARVREGEAVVTPSAADRLGRERIRAENAGMTTRERVVAVSVYQHHAVSRRYERGQIERRSPLVEQIERNATGRFGWG